MSKFVLAAGMAAGMACSAHADVVWNFNSVPPDTSGTTGSLVPVTGSGSIVNIGGLTQVFASGSVDGGSSDPATTDDTALNFSTWSAQGTGSGAKGVQFNASTAGMSGIIVTFDVRTSNSASAYMQFQYDLGDGNGWQNSTLFFLDMGGTGTGGRWFNGRSVDLSAIPGANNNPNFAFRVMSVFEPSTSAYRAANAPTSPYNTSGTWRFDMVSITPTPGSMALIGLAGLAAVRRRR